MDGLGKGGRWDAPAGKSAVDAVREQGRTGPQRIRRGKVVRVGSPPRTTQRKGLNMDSPEACRRRRAAGTWLQSARLGGFPTDKPGGMRAKRAGVTPRESSGSWEAGKCSISPKKQHRRSLEGIVLQGIISLWAFDQ